MKIVCLSSRAFPGNVLRDHFYRQPFFWPSVFLIFAYTSQNSSSIAPFLCLAMAAIVGFFIGRYRLSIGFFILMFIFLMIYNPAIGTDGKDTESGRGDGKVLIVVDKLHRGGQSGIGRLILSELRQVAVAFTYRGCEKLKTGDEVTALATLLAMQRPVSPNDFDARAYYAQQGCVAMLQLDSLLHIDANISPFHLRSIEEKWLAILPKNAGALLWGLFTGRRQAMGREQIDAIRTAGVMHLFAVSGFHLGLFFLALLFIGRLVPGFSGRYLIALLVIWLYCWWLAWPVSAVRAAIMLSTGTVSLLLGSRAFSWSNYWLAFFLILAASPDEIASPGFQLSFTALAGILLFLPQIKSLSEAAPLCRYPRLQRLVVQPLLITFAAQYAVTLPLSMWFDGVNIFAPFINILATPAVVSLMLITPLCLVAEAILPGLILPCLEAVVNMLMWSLQWAAGQARVFDLSAWTLSYKLFFFVPPLFLLSRRTFVYNFALHLLLIAIIIAAIVVPFKAPPLALFLNVGQGDCFFSQTPYGKVLIDAGNRNSRIGRSLHQLADSDSLSLLVITHADADHFAGLLATERPLPVKRFVSRDTMGGSWYRQVCGNYRRQWTKAISNVLYSDPWLRVYCLDDGQRRAARGMDKNDCSLYLLVESRQWQVLITGDAGVLAEAELKAWRQMFRRPIYKAGHHGSRGSSGRDLLHWLKPQMVIISCGYKNRFGHPHAEVLERLQALGIAVFRTDMEGYWQQQSYYSLWQMP
jgi:competence protein ComEC